MSDPLPKTSLYLAILRGSLAVGGLYDLVLGGLLLVAPDFAARLLSMPLPGEDFYLWLLAILVLMAAGVYLLAAYDPMAYAGNVLLSIAARAAAGAALVYVATGRGDLEGLYLLGAVDLAFAAVHAASWWPTRHLREQLL